MIETGTAILVAIIGTIGILIGGGITILANNLLSKTTYEYNSKLERERWERERENERGRDGKETVYHYLNRIENYASERRAVTIALQSPLLHPDTVLLELFKDTWKGASLANEALDIAIIFGENQLANDIHQMEIYFWKIYNARKQNVSEESLKQLEEESKQIYSRINSATVRIRAMVSQLAIQVTKSMEIEDIPSLLSKTGKEASNSINPNPSL